MKKYIAILFIIILTFSGCKNDGEDKPHIPTPTDVLSTSDIKEYIDFEPVAEKSETENSKTVKYKNQTPGISDIVEVTVYSENKNISKAEIEETKNGKFRIVITEIPYKVKKQDLVKNIYDLAAEKRIEGIDDVVDYSSKRDGGIRIVVDVKKELEIKKAEAPKPKRKYNKKKKSDDKA